MSDTPDTDQKAVPHIGFYSCATVTAEFARKLERERDQAIAGRQAYKQLAVKHAQERDEARRKLEDLDVAAIHSCHNECQRPMCVLRRERDKMQTELEMWRDGNIFHEVHRDELEKTERERDEARYFLEELAEADSQLKVRMAELCDVLCKTEKERDEAICEMNRYKRQWEESRSENVEGAK
jgi:hypothetical protein